jgi:hypothetical protein
MGEPTKIEPVINATILGESAQRVERVSPNLPYAHLVAENPTLHDDIDLEKCMAKSFLVGEISGLVAGEEIKPLRQQALDDLATFFDLLDSVKGEGPTMGEFMVIHDTLKSRPEIYQKMRELLASLDGAIKEKVSRYSLVNNPSSAIFYNMLLHYLLGGIERERRNSLLAAAKENFNEQFEPHLLLSFF